MEQIILVIMYGHVAIKCRINKCFVFSDLGYRFLSLILYGPARVFIVVELSFSNAVIGESD
jgi:hypothetical protein